MSLFGLLTGLIALLLIGLGFPLVIHGERLFGYALWPYLMGAGALLIAASPLVPTDLLAVILGILGATFVWGSTELKEQAVRAELGWYPFNSNKLKLPLRSLIEKWKAPHL